MQFLLSKLHIRQRRSHLSRTVLFLMRVGAAALLTGIYVRSHAADFALEALDMSASLDDPGHSGSVAVVHVSDEDLKNLFGGKWPPRPQTLQRLIDGIALGRPKVIGIDLKTVEAEYAGIRTPPGTKVVWARIGTCPEGPGLDCPDSVFTPQPVLGGDVADLVSGIATLWPDHDGLLRRYERMQSTAVGRFPTFAFAVAAAADSMLVADTTGTYLINMHREQTEHVLTAGEVLELSQQPSWPQGELYNKVVLLGGAFERSGDIHRTALTTSYGVDIWAHIVANELDRRSVPAPGERSVILLAIAEAMLLTLVLQIRHRWIAWSATGIALSGLALGGSYLVCKSLILWRYFVPVVLLVLAMEVYERVKHRLQENIAH
jgi:CHASE2 domain-containing sensor protein